MNSYELFHCGMYVITVNDAMHSILVLSRIMILSRNFYGIFHLDNCKIFAGSAARSLVEWTMKLAVEGTSSSSYVGPVRAATLSFHPLRHV